MNKEEADDLLNSIFPVNEERWIKLKYLDQKKCIKMFPLGQNNKKSEELAKERGFDITAIGVRDEWTPQVSAILELKDDINSILLNVFDDMDDYRYIAIREAFKNKIEEIKQRTIKDVPIEGL